MSELSWLPGADLAALGSQRGVRPPAARAAERAKSWRICERCQKELLLEPEFADWLFRKGESAPPLLCEGCKAIVSREEQAKPVIPGARCVHVDYQRGPFSGLVVTEVNGDRITVAVLGLGGVEPERQTEITTRWWPGVMLGRRTFHRNELLMKGL